MPRGISVRKGCNSIYMEFSYRRIRCREYFNLAPTKANIKWAANKRASVLSKIRDNTFNYADEFPNSRRAYLFGHFSTTTTLGELLTNYLKRAELRLEYSTYKDYLKSVRLYLRPEFGKINIVHLTPIILKQWIEKNLSLSLKRINNVLIPLRHVVDESLNDGIIKENPFDRLVIKKLLPRNSVERDDDGDVDPFDEDEMKAILRAAEDKPQYYNLLKFAFFTGLRPSEIIALNWSDIDLDKEIAHIRSSDVMRHYKKRTKTRAGIRDVILLPPAIEALHAQKPYSYSFYDRVFLDPNNSKPWLDSKQLYQRWTVLMKKTNVRFRKAYNTRHTYASMMISRGESELFLITQMGHSTTEMIRRHYVRWIKDKSDERGYRFKSDWKIDLKK